jgi:hypothetical protein
MALVARVSPKKGQVAVAQASKTVSFLTLYKRGLYSQLNASGSTIRSIVGRILAHIGTEMAIASYYTVCTRNSIGDLPMSSGTVVKQ